MALLSAGALVLGQMEARVLVAGAAQVRGLALARGRALVPAQVRALVPARVQGRGLALVEVQELVPVPVEAVALVLEPVASKRKYPQARGFQRVSCVGFARRNLLRGI